VRHIVDVMTHFKEAWGLEFEWVGPINEPEADWWKAGGGQPGSHVSPEQAIVIYRALEKALKGRGFENVKVTAYDAAFTNTTEYLDKLLAADIEPAIDVLTCHQYVTSPEGLEQWAKRAEQFDKELWMSEWGDWDNAKNKPGMQIKQMMNYAGKLHEAFDVLQASAWIMWEAGFLFNDGPDDLERRKAYWAVAHYSRHIRPGAQRIACQSATPAQTTVFRNAADAAGKAGSLVIVTVNQGAGEVDLRYAVQDAKAVRVIEARRSGPQEDYAACTDVRIESGIVRAAMGPQSVLTVEIETAPQRVLEFD
jgi:O-glycosyl hydrolase